MDLKYKVTSVEWIYLAGGGRMKLRVPTMRGISSLAERLLASQEGLCLIVPYLTTKVKLYFHDERSRDSGFAT